MKKLSTFLLLATSTVLTSNANADIEKGKALYATCVACHQADGHGNQMMKAPAIAGQSAWYVETQLKNYKAGIRGADPKDAEGMMMAPMSKMLATDADIASVAQYVASLTPANIEHSITDGNAEKGKALYMTCIACHGQNGEGNEMLKSPKLTGLNDWYIVAQLKKFKDGLRGAHPQDTAGATMRPMSMTLPDEQAMKDVVAYINSLSK